MHLPPAAVRPAVPDSSHARRRTNSNIPQMTNIHPPYYHPPPQPPYPYHCAPQTPPPVAASLSLQPLPTSQPLPPPPPPPPQVAPAPLLEPVILQRPAFKPPLPWYSAPGPFPGRRRRRRKPAPPTETPPPPRSPTPQQAQEPSAAPSVSVSELATPPTTNPPSEVDSTHPTTPSSTAPPSTVTSVPIKPAAAVPLTPPAVPAITPKSRVPKSQKTGERPQPISTNASTNGGTAPATPTTETTVPATPTTQAAAPAPNATQDADTPLTEAKLVPEATAAPVPAPQPIKPASWADLLKNKNQKAAAAAPTVAKTNGPVSGLNSSLEEALKAFQIHGDLTNTPFLEPRGLVNTGNMCFMNAILQMLVFCGPFYYFLDRAASCAKHIKHNTPLIEAMIMFMREFRIITADPRSKIKSDDLESLGEPFAPEYFYETIRQLKRFSHMRQRGHQQDAEEFLGFLLDGLHEEAVEVMQKVNPTVASTNGATETEEAGWMEVGPKQKAATTRTTEITESPITKIFGGKLRSVFSVTGLSNSVILEPYTPLQLDIHTSDVNSVVDALKHLTTPESLQDFKSPKGPNVTATKQVFIETLPPVLILHLKRFQYDNTGGTQKIWKKIAYPLELVIPREAMSKVVYHPVPPKYRLIGVVYHHGSSAQGGHYTVDVLRQDAKSWIRLDDTSIQMVASRDVAVDVKDIGKYNADGDDCDGWVGNWEQVNGSGSSGQNKGERRYVGKDSRTAYILFYQRI
ncbi:hypothetical protein FN846DRAFT_817716 [Sphaerosporella brunnea]|uniref:Ubiquitin carboxyl-terminal hydrolase n=1 Tax=Sphaerosporella brunnea TaxID=1250544 RepID=A0A5J5EJN7_9PEZI|nr:hypothetical protein FN846DRAFT_817716 [Sphaerosporella brunnea]